MQKSRMLWSKMKGLYQCLQNFHSIDTQNLFGQAELLVTEDAGKVENSGDVIRAKPDK